MILVIAQVQTTSSAISALTEAMTIMEAASNAEEGCVSYVFTQQISDPSKLRVVEIWQSMEVLQEHFQTPHMAAFNGALAQHPKPEISLTVRALGEELPHP